MITHNDAVRLLALCAAADQRTVGDEDVKLWRGVANAQRWTVPAASAAIIEHYSSGADRPRITPAAITDRIRAIRRTAAESFEAPRIPDDLPDQDYPKWYRQQLAAHIDAVTARWAETGQEPRPAIERAGGPLPIEAAPPELQDQIRRDIDRIGSLRRPDRHLSQRLRGERDPEERRKARAELVELHRRITQPDTTEEVS